MRIKNRGSNSNPEGRFEIHTREAFDDGWAQIDEETIPTLQTQVFEERAKTIITRNDSPDIGFDQSINPYRGCEHGCIYCYARPAHAYMNLSPGLDFESKIFYKLEAAELLAREIQKPSYVCKPIIVGANTDPYQPLESRLKVTRSLLEVFLQFEHPLVIITKGALIERDLDLLTELGRLNLVKVAVSVTTLSDRLKHILEPRTGAPKPRLRAIKRLTEAGIPVRLMAAPMIPMINDVELENILASGYEAGARHASYTLVRLPYEVKDLFKEWLSKHFPERANHVMSIIRQMRGGKDYDSTFGTRMRGTGEFADLLEMRFQKACRRLGLNITASSALDTTRLKRARVPEQYALF